MLEMLILCIILCVILPALNKLGEINQSLEDKSEQRREQKQCGIKPKGDLF